MIQQGPIVEANPGSKRIRKHRAIFKLCRLGRTMCECAIVRAEEDTAHECGEGRAGPRPPYPI